MAKKKKRTTTKRKGKLNIVQDNVPQKSIDPYESEWILGDFCQSDSWQNEYSMHEAISVLAEGMMRLNERLTDFFGIFGDISNDGVESGVESEQESNGSFTKTSEVPSDSLVSDSPPSTSPHLSSTITVTPNPPKNTTPLVSAWQHPKAKHSIRIATLKKNAASINLLNHFDALTPTHHEVSTPDFQPSNTPVQVEQPIAQMRLEQGDSTNDANISAFSIEHPCVKDMHANIQRAQQMLDQCLAAQDPPSAPAVQQSDHAFASDAALNVVEQPIIPASTDEPQPIIPACTDEPSRILIMSDSICRNMRKNNVRALINKNKEEIEISKHSGATADQIKSYLGWWYDHYKPNRLVISAGANDLLYENNLSIITMKICVMSLKL